MKNPPMTMVRIDALGLTHVPRVADTSQITELSWPAKPAKVDESHFSLSVLDVHSNLRNGWVRDL